VYPCIRERRPASGLDVNARLSAHHS
jgi:hypothetical protein